MADDFITKNDLNKIIDNVQNIAGRVGKYMSTDVLGNIVEFAPVDEGKLHSLGSWHIEQRGNATYVISTQVPYALVQNDGSDPYQIYPRVASVLCFQIDGQTIYAKEVSHPGVPGTQYIESAISKSESRAEDFITKALRDEGLI